MSFSPAYDSTNCEYEVAATLHSFWHNYSSLAFNGNIARFDDYVCKYAGYSHLKLVTQPIERQLIILFSTFGFLGGLLTVLTLSQKRFLILDFRLYRHIGYLEMGQMMDLAIMDLLAFLECDTNYACTFLWAHVGFVFMNVCADAIDLLVLFLCVERTVACLLPHYFQRLHTRACYTGVFAISVTIPTFFNLFSAFELTIAYDENQKRYRGEPSQFRLSDFYTNITHVNTARFYIMAALIMVATVFSLWGLVAVARRRRHLSSDYAVVSRRNGANGGSEMNRSIGRSLRPSHRPDRRTIRGEGGRGNAGGTCRKPTKRETELCCLQLCLAVPIIINHILYATGLPNIDYEFVVSDDVFKKGMDYETAITELERVVAFYYLRMATNLTNVLAHALHFYLYLLFSVKVRKAFVLLLKRCRAKLWPKKYGTERTIVENNVARVSLANEISVV